MGRARAPGVAVTSPLCREGPRLVRSRLQMARQPCEHGTHFAPQFMLLGGLCAFPLGRRQTCYPAHWAWEAEAPFSFVQCDVKDVYDKGTLGTELTTHLARLGLPRYQWTFLEGQSRLRFLAYSQALTQDCGLAFVLVCLNWIQRWRLELAAQIQIQTDWGAEFGGGNPNKVHMLNQRYLLPLGARLCRYPLGRKGYNGRIERLHCSDGEEFYKPTLLDLQTIPDYLDRAYPPYGGSPLRSSPRLVTMSRLITTRALSARAPAGAPGARPAHARRSPSSRCDASRRSAQRACQGRSALRH